jgi:DNA-binding GntR family transcriptional regulator
MRLDKPGATVRDSHRFKPVDRETYQQQVYAKLCEALMRGQFMPGEGVTLRGLAHELGTSLTPVREALRQLIAEQALEVGENRKVVVPAVTHRNLDELRKLRVVLEGMLTEAASRRINQNSLDKLMELNDEMIMALKREDAKKYLARNQAFHFCIYRASGLPISLRVIEGLWLRIGPTFNFLLVQKSSRHLSHVRIGDRVFLSEHHDAIVAAMRHKRHSSARKAMEADINAGMRFLIGLTAPQ